MKISSLQENLKNGLQLVGHIAGKNVNLPILNNILIKCNDDGIKLITTDLELGITCTIRGKVEKVGEFTVEAKIISDFISLLPNNKVDLEVKENKLTIKSENYKTVIKGLSAEEYPLIPTIEKKNYFEVPVDEFKKALSQVIFAVSNSDNRLELTGVLFDFKNDELFMAATDSFRLAEKRIKIKKNNPETVLNKIIIPAKTLQELVRILSNIKSEDFSNESKNLNIYLSDNQILFTIGNVELISRLIDGQYPDYKQIIPVNSKTTVIINKNELIRAVKTSSIFSKTGINDVNIDLPANKNKMIISSTSSQTGENLVELDAQVEGDDNGVVLNYKFLLDGINNINDESIKMKIVNSNTPCLLSSVKEDDYLYVIMPIKQ